MRAVFLTCAWAALGCGSKAGAPADASHADAVADAGDAGDAGDGADAARVDAAAEVDGSQDAQTSSGSDAPGDADARTEAGAEPDGQADLAAERGDVSDGGCSPSTCAALDQCHGAGVCDPATGGCSNPPLADGTRCDDGNACTQTDACLAGVCVGATPVTCTARDACHLAGSCDPATGSCSNPPATSGTVCNAEPGDLLNVQLDQLRPTQKSLGFDEIYYKLGRYTSNKDELAGNFNKRFDDYCQLNGQLQAASVSPGARLDNPSSFACAIPIGAETPDSIAPMKTVVIGPRGVLYLTDGHHSLTSMWEAPDGGPALHVRLVVQDNLSHLDTGAFWAEMKERNLVWLYDENNQPITAEQLPASLGLSHLANDVYRATVYFTRNIGYSALESLGEFQEFYWGRGLRGSSDPALDPASYDLSDFNSYLALIKAQSKAEAAYPDTTIVSDGKTARDLGKLSPWNAGNAETAGEFAKLSKPYSDPKPGKLAYALHYKASLGACRAASECPPSDSECTLPVCGASKKCGFDFAAAGTPTTTQTAGDCRQTQCDGSGHVVSAVDDTDAPLDRTPCTADICAAGVASHPPLPAGTSCGGSNVCDGAGACVGCVTADDCAGTDTQCQVRTCTAGVCGVANVPHGTDCTDGAGRTCDGAGSCVVSFRVVRVGAGATTLSSAATAVFVDEYTIAGTSVGTVALPTDVSGTNRVLTLTGTGNASNAEGGLSLSSDGRYVVVAGYDAAPGTAAVASTSNSGANPVNRIVARVDASAGGNVDTSTRFVGAFDGNAVRGVTTFDGTAFWAAGAGSATKGTWYLAFGATGGVQIDSSIAMRWLEIHGGRLYGSSDKGPNIFTIGDDLPTASSPAAVSLPASYPNRATGQSPFGFVFFDVDTAVPGVDLLYVADDTTRGIKKWTLDGVGKWNASATSFTAVNSGAPPTGFRGLAAYSAGSTVMLIAGTADAAGPNRIVRFIDDGLSTSPVGTVIVGAPANTSFRGLALSPHL